MQVMLKHKELKDGLNILILAIPSFELVDFGDHA